MKKKINFYWLGGCIIALIVIIICSLQLVPQDYKKTDTKTKIIFESSLYHLNNISKSQHSYGTLRKEEVKNYIISTIQKHHLNTIIQNGTVIKTINYSSEKTVFAYVENIYVEIPGEKEDRICLVAHYDSVAHSFGAADDSSSVSALLSNFEEIADDYNAGKRFKNTIIFLFTDAEELGLLGAQYFVENYPEITKIKAVLNLEARGNSGKSILFQSNDKYNRLIKQYSKHDKNLIGFSFANDIYKKMPNNTDFSTFLIKGIDGLNFAYIQNSVVYHTFLDNAENLSLNSLYETNLKAKNFLSAFSNYDFSSNDIKKAKLNNGFLYFSIFGKVITLSKLAVLIFSLILLIVFTIMLLINLKQKYFSFKNFLISLLINIITFFLFALSVYIAKYTLYLLFPVLNLFYPNPYNEVLYFIAVFAIASFILHLIAVRLNRFIDFNSFYFGSTFFAFILLSLFFKILPGLSILFLLQGTGFVFIEITKFIFSKYFKNQQDQLYYLFHFLILMIPSLIGVVFSYLVFISLGLKNMVLSFIGLFPVVLFFIGNYKKILPYDRNIITTFLLIVCITMVILISFNIEFTEEKPILSSISIEKDNDTSGLSIIIPYYEVKYSNNPWYKSILSLGRVQKDSNIYIIDELNEVKLPKMDYFNLLSFSQTKKYKEYNIELKGRFWSFTLPENSQVFIKDYVNLSFDEISSFYGYTPYNKTIIIKLRIPNDKILKYKVGDFFFESKHDLKIPKRPKEILGVYDTIIEKGTLK